MVADRVHEAAATGDAGASSTTVVSDATNGTQALARLMTAARRSSAPPVPSAAQPLLALPRQLSTARGVKIIDLSTSCVRQALRRVDPAEERVEVRVIPRARRNEVREGSDGRLVVRVMAAPVDDQANVAVCKLVADHFGVRASMVEVVSGRHARDKVLRIRRR
jgi:uncharacterized protein YggU (UPF0235/DUF167 family)